MLTRCLASGAQIGFEASELLQEVETGDVGTREVSEAQHSVFRSGAEIWESGV